MNNTLLVIMHVVYKIWWCCSIVLLKTIPMKHKRTKIQLNKIHVEKEEVSNSRKKNTYVGLIGNIARTIYEHYEQLDPDIRCNLN